MFWIIPNAKNKANLVWVTKGNVKPFTNGAIRPPKWLKYPLLKRTFCKGLLWTALNFLSTIAKIVDIFYQKYSGYSEGYSITAMRKPAWQDKILETYVSNFDFTTKILAHINLMFCCCHFAVFLCFQVYSRTTCLVKFQKKIGKCLHI